MPSRSMKNKITSSFITAKNRLVAHDKLTKRMSLDDVITDLRTIQSTLTET
jgi:hypothetical protein